MLPQPWYWGCVLVIGDAAHASTPHLAAGAGMGVEDALMRQSAMALAQPY
jgi:2-polyprenyl-6-methoxyphenol hydroxylase-like FAD-dependent oxidoreductase